MNFDQVKYLDNSLDNNSDCVAIVMSTFNGAKLVSDQISAIRNQTYTNWHCYLRDDGSKDNTLAVVKPLIANDHRFTLIEDNEGNLRYNKTHYLLIAATNQDYIALCDQDDVWHVDKLEVSLSKLKEIETGNKIPAMVSTDSVVVDEELNLIQANFVGKRGRKKGLNAILFANNAQGGSVVINKNLKEIVLNVAPVLPCDYHFALIAELTGVRAFIPQTLLKYRQHSGSVIAMDNAESSKKNLAPKYPTSLLASLSIYSLMKENFNNVIISKHVQPQLKEYFYLFEGNNRFKKLYILFKNRYPFYGRKDFLSFACLLLKNKNIRNLKN